MLITRQQTEGGEGEHAQGEAAAPADGAPTNVPGQVIPLTETTNATLTSDKGAEAKKTHPPRERKQRGPPEDGVPSKTKVMVANLPYDLKEDKVLLPIVPASVLNANPSATASRDLQGLLPELRQDRPPPHPPFHGQEAPGSWRAPQGPWLRLRHARLRGVAAEGLR